MAVPLAVWPCAQTTAQRQRAGTYLPECREHPGKMLPDLARRIIRSYSRPGDLVVDPMCGIGTTLVEAVHQGRDAIGIEYEPTWADLAQANGIAVVMASVTPAADFPWRRGKEPAPKVRANIRSRSRPIA